jgi:hypothetical protein
LTVAEPDLSGLQDLYHANAALIRTDHHVAWRGDQLPSDVDDLLDVITGGKAWAR